MKAIKRTVKNTEGQAVYLIVKKSGKPTGYNVIARSEEEALKRFKELR